MYNENPLWFRIQNFFNERQKKKERIRLKALLEDETDGKKIEEFRYRLELIKHIPMKDYNRYIK